MKTQSPDSDKPQERTAEELELYDLLRTLLKPYSPADTIAESDKQYSTMDLKQAIELHLGIPQGDPDFTGVPGEKINLFMHELGYICANTRDLQLEWLLKRI